MVWQNVGGGQWWPGGLLVRVSGVDRSGDFGTGLDAI